MSTPRAVWSSSRAKPPRASAFSIAIFPNSVPMGENPHAAAGHLANQLTRALDHALTDWRRETLNTAIADVQAYTSKSD